MVTHSCGVSLGMCTRHRARATERNMTTAGENKTHRCARSVSCPNANFSSTWERLVGGLGAWFGFLCVCGGVLVGGGSCVLFSFI